MTGITAGLIDKKIVDLSALIRVIRGQRLLPRISRMDADTAVLIDKND